MGQHLVAVLEFDSEHRIREGLDDRPLYEDGVVFGLCQGEPPTLLNRETATGRLKTSAPVYGASAVSTNLVAFRVRPRRPPSGRAGPLPQRRPDGGRASAP